MQFIKSRVGTVLAGAAILALAGGGAAVADNWYGDDRGWDSNKKSRWDDDRHDKGRGNGHDRDPKGFYGYERIVTDGLVFSGGGFGWASCSDGKLPIGGGYYIHSGTENSTNPNALENGTAIVASFPSLEGETFNDPWTVEPGNAWVVQVNKPANVNPGDIDVYAICAYVDD